MTATQKNPKQVKVLEIFVQIPKYVQVPAWLTRNTQITSRKPLLNLWKSLESLNWLFTNCMSNCHTLSPVCSVPCFSQWSSISSTNSQTPPPQPFVFQWWIELGLILLFSSLVPCKQQGFLVRRGWKRSVKVEVEVKKSEEEQQK